MINLSQPDKLFHLKFCLGASFGMSLLFTPMIGFITAMAIGIAKELWDLSGHGCFEWNDLLADLIGAIGGALCSLLVKNLIYLAMLYLNL